MSNTLDPQQALRTAELFVQAVNAFDLDGMAACITDDFVQWHAHICHNFSWAEEIELLHAVMATAKLTLNDVRLTATNEGVLNRFTISLDIEGGASISGVPAGVLLRFRGDKIYRAEEFFDARAVNADGVPDALPIGELRGTLDSEGERYQVATNTLDWYVEQHTQIATNFSTCIQNNDCYGLLDLLAENASIWSCHLNHELSVQAYGEALIADQTAVISKSYKDCQTLYHPQGFIWEATVERQQANGSVTLSFFIMAEVQVNKITRLEYYFNTSPL